MKTQNERQKPVEIRAFAKCDVGRIANDQRLDLIQALRMESAPIKSISNSRGRIVSAFMQNPTMVCETSRLILRQFTLDDLAPLAAMHLDPEVSRFIGGVKTVDQTRQRLEQWLAEYERYGFSKWAVVLRSSRELIGRCGLSLEKFDDIDEWELGWTFARAHWGNGYATEAALAAMDHTFRVIGLKKLISLIRPGNIASVRVAERIGMTFDRTVQWGGLPAQLYVRFAPKA